MTNIFLTYLGISATVGVVVLLIMLASPLINRRYAAKWKYYIWIFLAIRLLIPVSGMYHAKSESPEISDTAPTSGMVVYEPAEVQEVQPRRFLVEIPVEAGNQVSQAPDTNSVKPKPSLFDIAIAAWIAGAVIFAAVPLISCLHYKYKITRGGERITDGSIFDVLQQTKSQLKIKRNVSLIRFNEAASPMIIGFISPALVLPCDEYSGEDIQFIIRHELIHLKRGDVYIKLLCVFANALHWFNPLIWIMRREAAIDMELSCDEGVIKGADNDIKKAYTETLMSSLRRQSSKRSSLTTQFYGGKGTMKKRFVNILGNRVKKNGAAVLIIAVVLATLLGVLVGCTQKNPDDGAPEVLHGYTEFNKADIPDIHYDGNFGLDELNAQAFPKVLFDSKEAGGVRVYLLGEHVRTDKSQDENAVYSYYLSLGLETGGGMATVPLPAELEGVSQGGYILNRNALSDYLSVYDMDCPLAVLRCTSSSGAQLSAFYAVKDGSLYMLMGDSSTVGGEAAGVCVPGISHDVTVSGNTLRDNASGVTYSFDFGNILPDDYVGAHFTASADSTELTDDEMNLPQGYAYNMYEGRVGQLEYDGVSYNNSDERVTFGFVLPEDWVLASSGSSSARRGDIKVFEIGAIFKTEELSADKIRLTPEGTEFPVSINDDIGGVTTIYAEEMGDGSLYDYISHCSTPISNGEIYERYSYIISRGGYSVCVVFVVNEYYDPQICETVLNSFAYLGEHFVADTTVTELNEEEMNRLISEYLRFERYTVYDSMSFTSTQPDEGVWIGDTFVQDIELDGSYYPSNEEGLKTWQEWLDFLHGIFTDESVGELLEIHTGEGKHYKNVDGRLYVLPSGGMGWPYGSPVQAGYETNGSTGVIEFWREDFSEGYEWWHYITTLEIRLTSFGWRIQSAESYDMDLVSGNPDGRKPLLDSPYKVDKSAYAVNQIFRQLMYDYYESVNILTFNACEDAHVINGVDQIGNLREIDGETYIPMLEYYDTPEEIRQQLSLAFTKQKCDKLCKKYIEDNDIIKEIDGRLYCALADMVHISFETPFESAVTVSDSEIIAKTVTEYPDETVPCEVTFKYEDGGWRIDKLVEDGKEIDY